MWLFPLVLSCIVTEGIRFQHMWSESRCGRVPRFLKDNESDLCSNLSEKPFINIKEPWTKVREAKVGEPFTTIPVKYTAYPEPSSRWCVHCAGSCSTPSTRAAAVILNFAWPATLTLFCLCRIKNGQPLREDYRIKQKKDELVIHGVTETDAGNYTIILSNRNTKEEQKRSFQLLVNGNFDLFSHFSGFF